MVVDVTVSLLSLKRTLAVSVSPETDMAIGRELCGQPTAAITKVVAIADVLPDVYGKRVTGNLDSNNCRSALFI